MSRKRGLGRGLDALIPTESEREASRAEPTLEAAVEGRGEPAAGLIDVPVEAIQPNPQQPRLKMDDDGLQELASSIREHGLIQPLIVTLVASDAQTARYQLIAGERRW